MKKSNIHRNGAMILFLCVCVAVTIVALSYAPKDPTPLKIEPDEQAYEYPEPIRYIYPCANKGTLRCCPVHKQKGVEIKK